MTQDQLNEIVECVRRDRALFYYFKDRYALMLLEYIVRQGRSVMELKGSQFRPLLQKPLVRRALASVCDGHVRQRDFQALWLEPSLAFRLTLGQWPPSGEKWDKSWHQMVRSGVNLVLQLNLPQSHLQQMEKLLSESRRQLRDDIHPVAGGREFTLAWSRIDCDLERNEALIEEVQSDWVRDVMLYARWERADADYRGWCLYLERCLRPYMRVWSEAMLAATIWFVRSELGVRRIFFHTFPSGNELKSLGSDTPPRSIYVDLPRRFCFLKTHNGPRFLRDGGSRSIKRKMRDPATAWYVLQL